MRVRMRVTPGCYRVRNLVVARLGPPRKVSAANELVYGKAVRDAMKELGWREFDIAKFQTTVLTMCFVATSADKLAADTIRILPDLVSSNN